MKREHISKIILGLLLCVLVVVAGQKYGQWVKWKESQKEAQSVWYKKGVILHQEWREIDLDYRMKQAAKGPKEYKEVVEDLEFEFNRVAQTYKYFIKNEPHSLQGKEAVDQLEELKASWEKVKKRLDQVKGEVIDREKKTKDS